eukprot:2645714-Prymnesium_polylepis.1
MHCANVAISSPQAFHSSITLVSSQMGPCSENWNRSGSSGFPLSDGFSIAKSEPARCAASSRTHSRLVISLARWSSRRCCLG